MSIVSPLKRLFMSWWQAGSERSNINVAHHELRRNAVHRAPSYSTPVIKAHGDPLHRQHFRTTFSLKTDRPVSDDFYLQQRTVDRALSRSVPSLVVIIMNTNREDPIVLHLIPFKTNTSRSNSEP